VFAGVLTISAPFKRHKENAMSAKVHMHLHVSDLGKSRDFYERFLGEGPVKVKAGYVKFLPGWAPVNLALSEGGHAAEGTVNHVGVQVDTVETVMTHLARVKAAGLSVREEMGVNCCHANQDKFWVQDPDGVEWEVYHLNYDLEDDVAKPTNGLQMAKGNACCAS
jgi:catechol 2,3-dioxygenase-like lactoylglutathione lyase family enzyme